MGAHNESPVPIVQVSPEPVMSQGDLVPIAPLETAEQGIREAIQFLTRIVSIHKRQLKVGVDARIDRIESLKVHKFLHLAPPVFLGSNPTRAAQDFIDHIYIV